MEKIFNWVLVSLGLGLIVFAFLLQWWGSSPEANSPDAENPSGLDPPGEGKASSHGKSLQAKYSSCFYCHWVKQDYTVQSEGGRRWRTIDCGVNWLHLGGETGKIFVDLASGGVEPELKLDFKIEKGGFRYLEYRIDEGEDLTAYAMAVKRERVCPQV